MYFLLPIFNTSFYLIILVLAIKLVTCPCRCTLRHVCTSSYDGDAEAVYSVILLYFETVVLKDVEFSYRLVSDYDDQGTYLAMGCYGHARLNI